MKNLILSVSLALLAFSCTNPDKPVKLHDHTCHRPADIPDTLSNGQPVYWDCTWQMDYNAGRVVVRYNEDGEPKAVGRYKKDGIGYSMHWGYYNEFDNSNNYDTYMTEDELERHKNGY